MPILQARKHGCQVLLKEITKYTGLSKIKFIIKNQTMLFYVLAIELPLISPFCPPRKPINIINHINISKTKKNTWSS